MVTRISAVVTVTLTALTASLIHAAPIVTFDLTGSNPAIDGVVSGQLTVSGVTATLTAAVSASTGVLNSNASQFGINATGTDDVDEIDAGDGTESVIITFSRSVTLTGITLTLLSAGEQANLAITSYSDIVLNDTGVGTDVYSLDNIVRSGESIVLSHLTGPGFSFNNFSIMIPEPTSAALLAIGGALLLSRRRRVA